MDVEYLKNDIPIYKIPIDSSDSIGICITFKVGSIYEEKDKRGISHLLEHMMFRSNDKYTANQVDEGLELNGGLSNAFTFFDSTSYLVETIQEGFDKSLDILYHSIINRKYRIDEFEKERLIVLSEIERYENDPESLLNFISNRALFGDSDLGDPVGGTRETILNINKEDIEDFKEKYYNPDNMIIIVEGRFSENHINKIKEYFNNIEGNSDNKKTPTIDKPRDIKLYMDNIKGQIYFSLVNRYNINDYIYLSALSDILSGGASSKLFQIFRNKYGIGYHQSLSVYTLYNNSVLSLEIPSFDKEKENILPEAIDYLINNYEDYIDQEYVNGRINRSNFIYSTKIKNNIFLRLSTEVEYILKFGKNLEEIRKEIINIEKNYIKIEKYLKELKNGKNIFIYPR
ncbi:peptidase M16 [Nanobdella aerobiophila]|uniref:Peptidase M16 n=1 Tax=Nanobdella aerobiophila TaxID=2586965 RepID=A0A915WSM1_9ARCH|nr:pitrilysin family protein [Nanobdella aerobiophila]BBL45460.1 peptidase M16 [Nanobdella aerobiophila]